MASLVGSLPYLLSAELFHSDEWRTCGVKHKQLDIMNSETYQQDLGVVMEMFHKSMSEADMKKYEVTGVSAMYNPQLTRMFQGIV